ncbi:hypothetical protein V6669_27300 [Paenibacillus sp. Y5S-9]|uniref:hypothetical protein n=1 Tax=Paenibacillus sp. Y5S-9 TaxID=3122489 RepID=UPI0030D18B16
MRKKMKSTLLNVVYSLQQATSNLETLVHAGRYTDSLEVLKACQEGAISIGTTIEQQANQDTGHIIKKLENYCESVYRVYINVENADYLASNPLKNLADQLHDIEICIESEIHVKYEVVFLPYKASMWDSMESVWKAANEDPNCNSYVIPVPYFEFIQNPKTQVLRYDGAEFPSYVPTMPFNNYDFKQQMPDVIYIHNPYDQYNNVTSVHPSFYASILKEYTDLLVYIPYFVTGGSISKSLTSLPTYQFMDVIVTQSESVSSFYKGNVASEKLVALGSPKVDKVQVLSKENRVIPIEWESIIQDKKIIFYNTSLSSLYEYREKCLEKMKDVFTCFKGRENEVLLWRPHPLVKATLKSTFPQLYQEYCEIEEEFIFNQIGILDASPDISLSVAISDAYIGEEGSSVIHLFGATGKPIFLLHYGDESINRLGFADAHLEGEELWFTHAHYNALCKMNIHTAQVEILNSIPNELPIKDLLYHDIAKVDHKLYFVPSRAEEMAIYDMENNKFEKVAYENENDNVFSKFTRAVRLNNFLYFLPVNHFALVRYNVTDGTFKYYSEIVKKIKKYSLNNKQGLYFMNAIVQEGESLFLAAAQTNIIIEFNTVTETIILHKVGTKETGFYRMENDGEYYWLISNEDGPIVKWNRKTNQTFEYDKYPKGFLSGGKGFFSIINCATDYMLLFPKKGNMIVEINKESGIMQEYILDLPYKEGERKSEQHNWPNNYYFVKRINEDQIVALTAYDSSLLFINTETRQVVLKESKFIKNESRLHFQEWGSNLPYACREGVLSNVEDFLDGLDKYNIEHSVAQKKAYQKVINNMDGTSGLKIHQHITNQLKITNQLESAEKGQY